MEIHGIGKRFEYKIDFDLRFEFIYSSRFKIPEVGVGKFYSAGRLRKVEGRRPYRYGINTKKLSN